MMQLLKPAEYYPKLILDGDFYLNYYSDLKQAGVDPLDHFTKHGIKEGRKPRENFSGLDKDQIAKLSEAAGKNGVAASFYSSYLLETHQIEKAAELLIGRGDLTTQGYWNCITTCIEAGKLDAALNTLEIAKSKSHSLVTNFVDTSLILGKLYVAAVALGKADSIKDIEEILASTSDNIHAISICAKYICRGSNFTNIFNSKQKFLPNLIIKLANSEPSELKCDALAFGVCTSMCNFMDLIHAVRELVLRFPAKAYIFTDLVSTLDRNIISTPIIAKIDEVLFEVGHHAIISEDSNCVASLIATATHFSGKYGIAEVLKNANLIYQFKLNSPAVDYSAASNASKFLSDFDFSKFEGGVFAIAMAFINELAFYFETKGKLDISLELYRICLNNSYLDVVYFSNHINHLKQVVIAKLAEKMPVSEVFANFNSKQSISAIEFGIQEFNVISGPEFAKKHQSFFKIHMDSHKTVAPKIEFLHPNTLLTATKGNLDVPDQYVAYAKNCIAFGRCNLIVAENEIIYDLVRYFGKERIVLGDYDFEKSKPIFVTFDKQTAIVSLPSIRGPRMKEGLCLFGVQSQNFGHWFVEYLPRLMYFENSDLPSNLPIYIDEALPKTILETIKLFNVHNREIIKLQAGVQYQFDGLYFGATPNYFPFDIKPGENEHDTIWPRKVFSDLRAKILNRIEEKQGFLGRRKRRIFITRKNFGSRIIKNEAEIIEFLKERGFETIAPEELTFIEQVELFKNASIVIGPCCSALSNALFCEPNTPVIGLIHDYSGFNFNGYSSYVEAGGAKALYVQGRTDRKASVAPYHWDFEIEIADLEKAINQITLQCLVCEIDNTKDLASFKRLITPELLREIEGDTAGSEDDNLRAYLKGAEAIKSNPNLIFDLEFYSSQIPASGLSGGQLLAYHNFIGRHEKIPTSVAFNIDYYESKNEDIAKAGVDPLEHYLNHGIYEGRMPIDLGATNQKEKLLNLRGQYTDNHIVDNLLLACDLYNGQFESVFVRGMETVSVPARYQTLMGACYLLDEECKSEFAINAYLTIIRIFGDNANIYYYIGIAYRRMGKLLAAKKFFDRAAEIDGEAEHIKKAKLWMDEYESSFTASPIKSGEVAKDLLVYETSFPDPISSFRFGEFDSIFRDLKNTRLVSCNWDVRSYGGKSDFANLLEKYANSIGLDKSNLSQFDSRLMNKYRAAYCVFLNNAAILQDRLAFDVEKFGFTLYPGGGFNPYYRPSDDKLERILNDKRCKYVVSTQSFTYNYLINSNLIEPSNIVHVFGGVVPIFLSGAPNISARTLDEGKLNICFVAQKYSAKGVEKGYDVLVEVARILNSDKRINIHVVGGYDKDVIDIGDLQNIKFYGIQKPDFFKDFYMDMDIILSPNISGMQLNSSGSFDGFPTTTCVEACAYGVAMFISDPLNSNKLPDGTTILEPNKEVEIIGRNPEEIAALIVEYANDRTKLKQLSIEGRKKMANLYSLAAQMGPRINALNRFLLN